MEEESLDNDVYAGDEVEISGLKEKVHLNGTKGRLVRFVSKAKRWAVECYDDRTYRLKPENLSVAAVPIRDRKVDATSNATREATTHTVVMWPVPLNHPAASSTGKSCYEHEYVADGERTPVPDSRTADSWKTPELYVGNRETAEALGWLSDALPMLASLNFLFDIGKSKHFEVANGEDAAPSLVLSSAFGNRPRPVDISCIANFHHLRNLTIHSLSLNGRYPFLFNFSNLRSLDFYNVGRLQWDLDLLVNMPKLERVRCIGNYSLTGSLSNIRALRETLIELCLSRCPDIDGNLMDLADLPLLKKISLHGCNKIVGDIRDVRPGDFQSIESLGLPECVWGGGHLPSIEETSDIMRAWYVLKKNHPRVFTNMRLGLSLDSPERYDNNVHHSRKMPAHVEFVQAGSRLGWRWTNCVFGGACETNWLDPKPANPSLRYTKELQKVGDDVEFYKGFFEPPTQEEHLQRNSEIPLDPVLRYSRGW